MPENILSELYREPFAFSCENWVGILPPCLGSLCILLWVDLLSCTLHLTAFHGIDSRICKLLALLTLVLHECGFPPRENWRIAGNLFRFHCHICEVIWRMMKHLLSNESSSGNFLNILVYTDQSPASTQWRSKVSIVLRLETHC